MNGLGLVIIVAVAAAGVAGQARASDSEELVREGLELRRSHRDSDALRVFQQAYELEPTPRTLAQIGFAEHAVGKWGAANRDLQQARSYADDPWIRKNRSSIESALVMVAAHVGTLEVLGTPPGAEVRVDGEMVGRLPIPTPLSVTAGQVGVVVRAPGYLSLVRAATINVGGLTRETFNLQALAPEGDAQASAPAPHSRGVPAASMADLVPVGGAPRAVDNAPKPWTIALSGAPSFMSVSGRSIDLPVVFAGRIDAGYSLPLATTGQLTAGIEGQVLILPYNEIGAAAAKSTSTLSGLLLTIGYLHQITRRLSFGGGVGAGVLWWTGLGKDNPFSGSDVAVTGAIPMLALRVGLQSTVEIHRGLFALLAPELLYSAATSGLGTSISGLWRFDLCTGLGYRF